MKIVKKSLKIILLFLILLTLGGWLYTKTLHPTYNGNIALTNLSDEVTVRYDTIGVPHINAENQKDAYRALGFVHAQDRLWQMELIRRIASGKLSEVFGRKLLKTDIFFSGLGIEEAATKTIQDLDKNTEVYQLTMAYLDGINQFIENEATPLEFQLVQLKKEKYTLKDVYNVFGYMAFSFAIAHKTDPMLTEVKEKLDAAYFNELVGTEFENLTFIKNEKNAVIKAAYARAMHAIYECIPIAPFIGSNSWVLAPGKTKNGKVIFANDPHIGFSQPSVWYQAHIKTPNYEMYGFNLALTPFPLLGHNRNYAYGLTMFENDDIDFYYEQNNPNNAMEYKTPAGFVKYDLINKRIKIKDEKDTIYQIKVSKHGPIINNLVKHVKNEKPIAMQWIYTKLKNQLLEVGHELSHANSLKAFKKGVRKLHAPGLNIMYGDALDNIAWFASAKLYKYRDSLYTKTILDGASGKDEILEYLDFEQNPQAINPNWNYVYSANNQPDSIAGILYPGYYLAENRARRIVNLLAPKNDWTKEDVATMLYDVVSPTAVDVIKSFLKSLEVTGFSASEKTAVSILKKWNGAYGKNEIAPVIYNRFVYEFQKNTFADEMGDAYNQFVNTPFVEKVLPVQAERTTSVWWDNINTKDTKETKEEIIAMSFKNAFTFLQNQLGENVTDWTWNRVASVEYGHALGNAGGVLRKIFNVGPFETAGGDQVINNQIFSIDSTGYYKITAGPSTRRVIDFSDVENSLAILPTGQSGNVFSDYYKDQAQKYLDGKFVKMMLNPKEIKQAKNVLILSPK